MCVSTSCHNHTDEEVGEGGIGQVVRIPHHYLALDGERREGEREGGRREGEREGGREGGLVV